MSRAFTEADICVIVDFGVAPHGMNEDRQPVYAYKDVYQSAGLRRGGNGCTRGRAHGRGRSGA